MPRPKKRRDVEQPSLWDDEAKVPEAPAPPPVLRFHAAVHATPLVAPDHGLLAALEEAVHRYCERVWRRVVVASGDAYAHPDGRLALVVWLTTYAGPREGSAEVRRHALAVAEILWQSLGTSVAVEFPGETLCFGGDAAVA
jgi:hypothetical protein